MNPVLFEVFSIPVYSYGFMMAAAFLICLLLILRRCRVLGIEPQQVLDLGLCIIIAGILGARVLYIILNGRYYFQHPLEVFLLNKGGLIFYGGLICALLAGYIMLKKRRLPVLKIADLFFVYLPLGHAIGRIGCFLNGCCYGRPAEVLWAVRFPAYSMVGQRWGPDNLVHPVQIYSSLANLVIFIILSLRIGYKKYDGQIILDYLLLYGLARYCLEYFRADNPVVICGLNVPQLMSLSMVIISLVIRIIRTWRIRANITL